MEYRKRQRSRVRRRQANAEGSVFGKILLFLLFIGGFVYLISASAAGTWLSANVFAPIFEAFRSVDNNIDGSPNPVDTDSISVFSGSETESEAKLDGISAYLLQTGIFSTEVNAADEADKLQKQGAAGYVYADSGKYRVYAALYNSESDANSVRERLKTEGTDCTINTLVKGTAYFDVNGATQEQSEALQAAFSELSLVHERLAEAAVSFDKENQTVTVGREAVFAIASDLKAKCEAIKKFDGDTVQKFLNTYESILEKLLALYNSDAKNTVDFSKELKYNSIDTLYEYVQLLEAFTP